MCPATTDSTICMSTTYARTTKPFAAISTPLKPTRKSCAKPTIVTLTRLRISRSGWKNQRGIGLQPPRRTANLAPKSIGRNNCIKIWTWNTTFCAAKTAAFAEVSKRPVGNLLADGTRNHLPLAHSSKVKSSKCERPLGNQGGGKGCRDVQKSLSLLK